MELVCYNCTRATNTVDGGVYIYERLLQFFHV